MNNLLHTVQHKKNLVVVMLCCLVLSACASHGPANHNEAAQDPLKNTKKLAVKGHSDLYNNGAFHVPYTEIALIPAAPSMVEFGLDLAGLRARQSFMQSLKNAGDSVSIVAEGSKYSYALAKDMHEGTNAAVDYIQDHARDGSTYLIYNAYPLTKDLIGKSWEFAGDTALAMAKFGDDMASGSVDTASTLSEQSSALSGQLMTGSIAGAKYLSSTSTDIAADWLSYGSNAFIEGYAALPQQLGSRVDAIGEAVTLDGFASALDKSLEYREQRSDFYADIFVDGTSNYVSGVSESFANAGHAFDDAEDTGFTLSLLKATRWVLQGLIWDGLVKPVGEIAVGSVGYLTVNTVTFPIMLAARSTVPVAEVAVGVTWNTAAAAYDIVAPTAIAATASVFSVAEFGVGQAAAGVTAVAGTAASGTTYIAGKSTAAVVSVAGYTAGKTVKYVGVPLAAAGIAVTGSAAGVVAGGASVATGSTLFVAGETTAAGTYAMGNVIAGTTLVAGTTASVAGGAAVGVYELGKAVVVPTSYTLGGGIVLGYGSISQLAAHSVLAVADASYLVLSLEGPRWVVYAVKGKLGQGENLVPGTVLNLENMQNKGEEFYYLPVSDGEMKQVVESVTGDLPVMQNKP